MRAAAVGFAVLAAGLCWSTCSRDTGSPGCDVKGPPRLVPAGVKRLRLGMSKTEIERLLGEADYSPIDGQYYFSTGGLCPLEETGRTAPCGVIADFRRPPGFQVTGSLQSCTWGAIGE